MRGEPSSEEEQNRGPGGHGERVHACSEGARRTPGSNVRRCDESWRRCIGAQAGVGEPGFSAETYGGGKASLRGDGGARSAHGAPPTGRALLPGPRPRAAGVSRFTWQVLAEAGEDLQEALPAAELGTPTGEAGKRELCVLPRARHRGVPAALPSV